MDAHGEVHAHSPRPPVGTKPAADPTLAVRKLPSSLRGDLGPPPHVFHVEQLLPRWNKVG